MIQPLHVVDSDEYRPLSGKRTEHAEQAERDGTRQRLLLLWFRAQQRHLERPPLRPGELGQIHFGDLGQQVAQCGVGQLDLGVIRPARQHPIRAAAGRGEALFPESGLPDANLTLDDQGHRSTLDRVEHLFDAAQLRFAADDRLRPRGDWQAASSHSVPIVSADPRHFAAVEGTRSRKSNEGVAVRSRCNRRLRPSESWRNAPVHSSVQ